MPRPRAHIFFDLGETLVELRSLVASLTDILTDSFPKLSGKAPDLAREWAIRSSAALPEAQGPAFKTEHRIGSAFLREILESTGVVLPLEDAAALLIRTRDLFISRVRLYPDAGGSWLESLRNRTAGMGIVTDGDGQYVPRILDRVGIRKYFATVTTSEDVRAYKPEARIYRAALEAAGAAPEDSLFVSDSALDLQGAAAVGMGAAHVARQLLPGRTTLPEGCAVLRSLRNLDAVLVRYAQAGTFRAKGDYKP